MIECAFVHLCVCASSYPAHMPPSAASPRSIAALRPSLFRFATTGPLQPCSIADLCYSLLQPCPIRPFSPAPGKLRGPAPMCSSLIHPCDGEASRPCAHGGLAHLLLEPHDRAPPLAQPPPFRPSPGSFAHQRPPLWSTHALHEQFFSPNLI